MSNFGDGAVVKNCREWLSMIGGLGRCVSGLGIISRGGRELTGGQAGTGNRGHAGIIDH